jgi:hypothetical protein
MIASRKLLKLIYAELIRHVFFRRFQTPASGRWRKLVIMAPMTLNERIDRYPLTCLGLDAQVGSGV